MYKIIGADQKEYGPVGADQIRQWIAEGRVNGQTQVQAAGAAEWKSVAEVAELAGALPRTAAPMPVTMPPPPVPGASQMAVWAMVAGICSLLCCCAWWVVAPIAIVLGAVALFQLKSHPEMTGHGFAIAGIVLGIVAILIYGALTVFYICNPQYFENLPNPFQQ
jgi:hypothetical protein